jgi:hypothetical protein
MHQVSNIFILSRNSTCFGHLLCPSSGVISCTRGNWYVSCRLCGRCLGESGWNLFQPVILSRNSTCFGHLLCPSSGVISYTRGNWYVSCRLCGRCLGESGWNLFQSDLTSRCPKHVEFCHKIKKNGYLMHLVGYLYEDYNDARSLEHKSIKRVLVSQLYCTTYRLYGY